MKISEVEQITGLTRSNIRFYEKEKLIIPVRNESSGYRDYSEEDVKNIKKIAYLRTLGISVDDIRKLLRKEADLYDIVKTQKGILEQQLSEMESAKMMCQRMLLSSKKVDYEDLDIEQYVTDLKDYWNKNSNFFKLDSISFFYIWGGNIVWTIIAIACLLVAVLSFRNLPVEIPVQWSKGAGISFVDKKFIFAFPVACVIARFLLRPFIWRWLKINIIKSDSVTDYVTNFLCFIALSVEIFIILYVNGIVRNVAIILFLDTFVLIGLLLMAAYKSIKKPK